MMRTMGGASTGKHLLGLLIMAVLCVVNLAHADDTTFIRGGNYRATYPGNPCNEYLGMRGRFPYCSSSFRQLPQTSLNLRQLGGGQAPELGGLSVTPGLVKRLHSAFHE